MRRKRKVSLSLDEFTLDLLRALAIEKDRSLSYMACVAVQNFAEDVLLGSVIATLKEHHGIQSHEEEAREQAAGYGGQP